MEIHTPNPEPASAAMINQAQHDMIKTKTSCLILSAYNKSPIF